jgi:hypothetical protein
MYSLIALLISAIVVCKELAHTSTEVTNLKSIVSAKSLKVQVVNCTFQAEFLFFSGNIFFLKIFQLIELCTPTKMEITSFA